MKPVIAVWFSCGAASAVAAKMTIERYGATHDIRILNNYIVEEGQDNIRFLGDVQVWLGTPIERVINPKYPSCSAVDVWDKRGYMSGVAGAPCTFHLKKEARQLWERENHVDWHVFGFTADEEKRHDNFVLTERDNVLPVLIDAGITKQQCLDILVSAGLRLPIAYEEGWPNANCKGCVKATSPTYWNHLRATEPEIFRQRAEQSRRLGVKLVRVNGVRIYLDELPPDAIGKPLKSLKMPECGIFCEEKL